MTVNYLCANTDTVVDNKRWLYSCLLTDSEHTFYKDSKIPTFIYNTQNKRGKI